MDPLYIVEFQVAGASPKATPATVNDRLVVHAVEWLSRNSSECITPEDLARSGRRSDRVSGHGFEAEREIRWDVTGTNDIQARQIRVAQDIQPSAHGHFVCAITLFRDVEHNVMRVEMGREVPSGRLTPTPVRFLRRPGIVGMVLGDAELTAQTAGQPVTGRYEVVDDRLAPIVSGALDSANRLPILLVDSRASVTRDFCRAASRELAGLVQVVALTTRAASFLADNLSDIHASLPPHGARLVWPDLNARHPDFTQEQIASKPRAVDTLLRMVAPLSVAARGSNWLLREATSATRRVAQAEFRAALDAARTRGNTDEELTTLQHRVDELETENSAWLEEIERLEGENSDLRNSEAEARYWREYAQTIQAAQVAPSGTSWDQAPECDPDDLGPLATFLQEASRGAIAFTASASRAWRRCGYPHSDEMGLALTSLAQAAATWRENECSTRGLQLDDWFKTQWRLNFAGTDKGLVQSKADMFEFEGAHYSRQPHLKLDDHTSPNQVGRVYFALDKSKKRFVVDHVGLKLYGL